MQDFTFFMQFEHPTPNVHKPTQLIKKPVIITAKNFIEARRKAWEQNPQALTLSTVK